MKGIVIKIGYIKIGYIPIGPIPVNYDRFRNKRERKSCIMHKLLTIFQIIRILIKNFISQAMKSVYTRVHKLNIIVVYAQT